MKVFTTILKVLWILVVLGFAGIAATLMGAFSMDAPSASMVVGTMVFLVVFTIIFLLGMAPIFLPALFAKFGKKDDASVVARKRMNGFAIGGAILWTGWRYLTSGMNIGGLLMVFFETFVVLYVIGMIVLKIKSKISKK